MEFLDRTFRIGLHSHSADLRCFQDATVSSNNNVCSKGRTWRYDDFRSSDNEIISQVVLALRGLVGGQAAAPPLNDEIVLTVQYCHHWTCAPSHIRMFPVVSIVLLVPAGDTACCLAVYRSHCFRVFPIVFFILYSEFFRECFLSNFSELFSMIYFLDDIILSILYLYGFP